MIQTRLQVPRIQTHFWDQQSLLEHVDSAIKCPSPTATSVAITRITETETENGALYCGFRRMSQPRIACLPKPKDQSSNTVAAPQTSTSTRPRSILKRRSDLPKIVRPRRTVTFDNTQYHRPEEHYRSDDEFDRSSSNYVPGIYADLSGNGYENTSRCAPSDLFDAQVDTYVPASHDALEKALRLQMEVPEPQESLPLPQGWLSERLQEHSSSTHSKSTKHSTHKKSRSSRSKRSEKGSSSSSCAVEATTPLRSQTDTLGNRAISVQ